MREHNNQHIHRYPIDPGRPAGPGRSVLPRRRRLKAGFLLGALSIVGTACASDGDAGESGATEPAPRERTTDEQVSDSAAATVLPSSIGDTAGRYSTVPPAEEEAYDSAVESENTAAGDDTSVERDVESEFADSTESIDDDSFVGANFVDYGLRTFVATTDDPLSTFSLDVDHGSYTVTRAALEYGQLPPPEAIRPEEFVNSFQYDYPSPDSGLTVTADGTTSPFTDDPDVALMRVGVSAEQIPDDARPPVALTFVVDTSGSMDTSNRLPMVKYSLRTLADSLQPDDTLAIVTYSDDAGVLLPPTPVSEIETIDEAIDELQTSGSTNLEAGLERGYELATDAFRDDGINGVVLASDGIANVGATSPDAVLNQIDDYATKGISLVTLGYGMEGYNDQMMEQLANDGDGFYAYIDAEREARRLFSDEITSTLVTVAKNSKVQVEFNPNTVAEYRLIGYENRAVLDSDFRNDEVDAGELGAGHQATAIYEVRFPAAADVTPDAIVASVHLRWESPETGEVTETDVDVTAGQLGTSWAEANGSLRLAVAATGFAEHLRFSGFDSSVDLADLAEIADAEGESDLADQILAAARLLGED